MKYFFRTALVILAIIAVLVAATIYFLRPIVESALGIAPQNSDTNASASCPAPLLVLPVTEMEYSDLPQYIMGKAIINTDTDIILQFRADGILYTSGNTVTLFTDSIFHTQCKWYPMKRVAFSEKDGITNFFFPINNDLLIVGVQNNEILGGQVLHKDNQTGGNFDPFYGQVPTPQEPIQQNGDVQL